MIKNALAVLLLGVFAISVAAEDSLRGDLVAHWMLDEAAIGQPVIDSSGWRNHGTHVNITRPNESAKAAVGTGSLSTDGVDDFVSVPADASLDLSGGRFSQSLWILPKHTDSDFHGILGYHDDGYLRRYPGIWLKEKDKIHAGFGDGTEFYSFSSDSVLTPHQWNHVVTTFDGNKYRLYVDGSEVFSSLDASGKVPYPTKQVTIGRIDNYFQGQIDDVRIYKRVLTASEVRQLRGAKGTRP